MCGRDVQVFDILETVSQIAKERVVQVLEHASLSDDVSHALGPYDCYTAWSAKAIRGNSDGVLVKRDKAGLESRGRVGVMGLCTFIFADILERKGAASVLSLYDANLSKGAFADNP